MDMHFRKIRIEFLTLLGLATFLTAIAFCAANAQTPAPTKSAPASQSPAAPKAQPAAGSAAERPLPNMDELFKQVEAHSKVSQKAIRDYIFRSVNTEQDLDSHGSVKKTTTEERENFWVNGVYISRLLARDGKPISGDELKKENERIDQRIAEAKQRAAEKAAGQQPKKKGTTYTLTFELLQRLGTFSNLRRVQLHGRDTIAIDYAGNPNAKTGNIMEGLVHDADGTLWFDEQDHAWARAEGHFVNDFKVGGGLLADVHKGATFYAEWTKVNGEVWLPASFSGRSSARIALFFNHSGAIEEHDSDYRKYRASSTILPGVVEAPGATTGSEPTPFQP